MKGTNKIYLYIALWFGLSALMFVYVFPFFGSSLLSLRASHQQEVEELAKLQAQVQNLHAMQRDLAAVAQLPVKPADLFTNDVNLVHEIKTVEDAATLTNNKLDISITGSVDQAKPYSGNSGLFTIPYIITTTGTFPNTIRFLQYLENSYFISPVGGIVISRTESGAQAKSVISTNFFIRK